MEALRKCTGCHSTILLEYFDKNRKGEYFKTCNNCRNRNRTQRARYIQNLSEEELKEYRERKQEYDKEHREEKNERNKLYIQTMTEEQKQHLREKQKLYRQKQQEKLDRTYMQCPRCGATVMTYYLKIHQKESKRCRAL